MENPKSVIIQFLSWIMDTTHPEYGRHYLTRILRPSLELEASIRQSFKTIGAPLAHSTDAYMGLFNAFILPSPVRVVYPRRENTPIASHPVEEAVPTPAPCASCGDDLHCHRFTYYSQTAHAICSFPKHTMFPLRRELFRRSGTPCMVADLSSFKQNLKTFTHGALDGITNWSNIVITGGAVVASLSGLPKRDEDWKALDLNRFYQSEVYRTSYMDIVLYGLTIEQALARTEEIYSEIAKCTLWPLTIIRQVDKVSIHSQYPCCPINIHLKLFASPSEIVANCDIDCSCCVYDGSNVYMNPRALVAFMLQTNSLDLSRWSPSYELRLAKYAARGFEVHVPFLEREKIDYEKVYNRNIEFLPTSIHRLFILELLQYLPDHLHALNNSKRIAKRVAPDHLENPSIYAPIDQRMENNDSVMWLHVPYGPGWDDKALHALVKNIYKQMNHFRVGRIHRHPICLFSNMADCLRDVCDVQKCPGHSTAERTKRVPSDEEKYCSGPLTFYPMGVNRKCWELLLGYHKPEREKAFIARKSNYLDENNRIRAEEDPIFAVLPREVWNRCVLSNDKHPDFRQHFERYTDTEGAARSVVSLFRIYAAVDDLINSHTRTQCLHSRSEDISSGEASNESNVEIVAGRALFLFSNLLCPFDQ